MLHLESKIGHCVLSLYNIYIIYKIYTHNMSQLYHYPHVFERRPKEVMVGLEFHFFIFKSLEILKLNPRFIQST